MSELSKIGRTIQKVIPEAPHETLIVLDSTTGQNAIAQAKFFNEVTPITGIILTKFDGTAKGGVVLAVKNRLNIPVKLIGVGETIDDLKEFNAQEFVEALFN
jgi:fused signal recognition particle receptor